MSLPIIHFRSRFPILLVLSCAGCVLGVSLALQTQGPLILGLQSDEAPGERGCRQDRREMCTAICAPVASLYLATIFFVF